MKTKKALGALLGLFGSLPAFPFLPLAAGFSAPLLFTANLQRTNGSKKMESSARHRNRSGSRVNPPHLASALAAPLDLAPFMMADCCVNSNGDGQIRERRFEEGEGEFGEAHLERTARGKGRQDALRGEWGIRRPPFSAIPSDLHPTPNLNFQADPPHDMWGRQRPGPGSSYSDRLGGLGAAHVQVVEGLFAIPRKRGGRDFGKKSIFCRWGRVLDGPQASDALVARHRSARRGLVGRWAPCAFYPFQIAASRLRCYRTTILLDYLSVFSF